jgi:hypothetical protein
MNAMGLIIIFVVTVQAGPLWSLSSVVTYRETAGRG